MEKQKHPPTIQYERTPADVAAEDASKEAWDRTAMNMMHKSSFDKDKLSEFQKANPNTLRALGVASIGEAGMVEASGQQSSSVESAIKEAGRYDLPPEFAIKEAGRQDIQQQPPSAA